MIRFLYVCFCVVALSVLNPSLALAAKKKTFCQQAKDFKSELYGYVDNKMIEYDFTKSVKFLTKNNKEALSEWQSKQEDIVWASSDSLRMNGMLRGGIGVETRASFLAKPDDRYGSYYCPYIKRLEIRFFYKSTLFVASDFPKGTCDFDAIFDHETKHHDVNITAVNDVVKKFKRDLPTMVSYLEQRYIKKEDVANKFTKMQSAVRDAFEIYSSIIFEEMEKKNALVDTPAEYERGMKSCP